MRKLSNSSLRTSAEKRCRIGYKRKDIYLILDNLRSVYNIGAIFRTADAIGVKKIYLCGICACPPRDDLHKTALGCEDHVDWEYVKDTTMLLKKLKQHSGITIVALEQTDASVNYQDIDYSLPLAIVVGNEVNGINQDVLDLCDLAVDIPMSGWANSLNVTTALGVVLFHVSTTA